MKTIFLLSLSILICNMSFSQGNYPFSSISRSAEIENYSSPDSLGNKVQLKHISLLKANSTPTLPYPIIFIHGLVGKSATWDTFTDFLDENYGLIYGGRMDYCLNYDGDNTIANKNFWPTTNADLATFTSTLKNGDYYYLNFDVGLDGSYNPVSSMFNVWSNQQAIVKQGIAVGDAIARVLKATGKDKVILMGHSMGGLAAREYLQNTINWQPDSKHHVAKLVTTGTPHGGSNSTSFGVGLSGISEKMDATRDLRRSYAISRSSGVYLFGGLESNSIINNNILFNYYNVDVNCNGIYGETITGLNYKNFPINLDISCIVGECSTCILDPSNAGDGIVNDYSSNISNFYNIPNLNLFYSYSDAITESHTDLPKQIYDNMKGLDEPNYFSLAYNVDFNKTYKGYTTIQPTGGFKYDYDDYTFSLTEKSNVNVLVSNIKISDLMIDVIDSQENKVSSTINCNGQSSMNFSCVLDTGIYSIEIYGTAPSSSYLYSYDFILTSSQYYNLSTSNSQLFLTTNNQNSSTFSITSNTAWSIQSNQSWLTLSENAGTGNASIIVTASENPTSISRSATVTIFGTGTATKTITITQEGTTTEISDFENNDCFLFPNPTSNYFNIDFSLQVISISIYDENGKLVLSQNNPTNRIDISNLVIGIYFIKLQTTNGLLNGKIIKNI